MVDLMPEGALNQSPFDGQLRGQTPLHIVSGGRDCDNRRHLVIAKLVNAKADIEARDLNYRTPLLVTAGAAYRNGAEALHDLGADMTATKRNGRNFADEALGSNKKLAQWWCDTTGLQPSGAPKETRPGMFKREGVSAKRRARLSVKKEIQKSSSVPTETWVSVYHRRGGAASSQETEYAGEGTEWQETDNRYPDDDRQTSISCWDRDQQYGDRGHDRAHPRYEDRGYGRDRDSRDAEEGYGRDRDSQHADRGSDQQRDRQYADRGYGPDRDSQYAEGGYGRDRDRQYADRGYGRDRGSQYAEGGYGRDRGQWYRGRDDDQYNDDDDSRKRTHNYERHTFR